MRDAMPFFGKGQRRRICSFIALIAERERERERERDSVNPLVSQLTDEMEGARAIGLVRPFELGFRKVEETFSHFKDLDLRGSIRSVNAG